LRRTSSAEVAERLAAGVARRDDEAAFFGAARFLGAVRFFGAAALRCWAVLRAAAARFFVVALAPDLRADCFLGCGISHSLSLAAG
jgi:hypothetical protein